MTHVWIVQVVDILAQAIAAEAISAQPNPLTGDRPILYNIII